jgi:serine/threonine-protein kinase
MKHVTLLPDELAQALPLYLEAIALDPTFALARANLAVMLFDLIIMGELPLEGKLEALKEAAAMAVTHDPALALGQVALGAERLLTHDWPGADECLRQMESVAPNLPIGQAIRTVYLTGMARFEEGHDAALRTRRLDPLAPYAHWLVGWSLHYARRPIDSIRELHRVLELFADYPLAWIFLAKCHFQLGDSARTLDACRRSLALMPENPMTLGYVAHMLAGIGHRSEAEGVMTTLDAHRTSRGYVAPYYRAAALCGLDRMDDALVELERLRPDASTTGVLLGVDPLLDPLRGEPRFDAVLRRTGLAHLANDAIRVARRDV